MSQNVSAAEARWPSERAQQIAAFAYGTLAAAFFAFVVYPRQGMIAAGVDLNGFGELSRSIAEGKGFSLNYGPTLRRAPLYPGIGAALLTVFGNDPSALPDARLFRPLIAANCVFFGLTCLVVWHLARALHGVRGAAIAVLVCPLIPQSLRYVGMSEVETLMGLWVALLALTTLRFATKPGLATGAAAGATVGLATLSKPVTLLFPFFILPLLLFYWWKVGTPRRARLLGSGALVAAFGALLLPWMIRNMVVTDGRFKGISGNGPGEFLRGYINAQSKYFLLKQDFGGGGPQAEKWDPEANAFEQRLFRERGVPFYYYTFNDVGRTTVVPTPPPGTTSIELELQKDKVEGEEAKRRLLQEPGAFLRKFAIQLFTFWYIVETRTKSLLVGSIALVMLTLCALGCVRAHRLGNTFWPAVAVIAYFNCIYAAILSFARYSMPLYPTLAAIAAGGALFVLERVFKPRQTAA